MKENPQTVSRDREIAHLKDIGYTTDEIYKKNFKNSHGQNLSKRYIQQCIRKYSEVDYNGRITDSKIFSLRDLENIIKNPDRKNTITKKRVITHYKKSNEKYLNINPTNKTKYQAKLRANVFNRDNYTCQECGSYLGIECHHIKFKDFKSIDDEISCCKTLCYKCHRKIHGD